MDSHVKCIIPVSKNRSEEESISRRLSYVILYTSTFWNEFFFWFLIVSTCGIVYLPMHWFPMIYLQLRYHKTAELNKACCVVVVADDGKKSMSYVSCIEVHLQELDLAVGRKTSIKDQHASKTLVSTVLFEHFCSRYVYHPKTQCFEYVQFDVNVPSQHIYKLYSKGIESVEVTKERQLIYGYGCIHIQLPPFYQLIVSEVLHPFYVFQTTAIILCLNDEYYSYTSAIIILTIISLAAEIFEIRRNHYRLREIAKYDTTQYVYQHDSKRFIQQDPRLIVPGDIVQINYGILPCDMILLEGSLLVNESMISGECIPVLKVALNTLPCYYDNTDILIKVDYQTSQYVLFGGTEVVQLKNTSTLPVGLIIRTGFGTAQGRMMRIVMHPLQHKRNEFIFETYKYLVVLVVIAFIAAFATLYMTLSYKLKGEVVAIRFFDTFTNAIPPVLPATMVMGAEFAVARLRRYFKVMCIVPSKINVAGQVNTFVFDKTGTLTEDTYEIQGLVTTNKMMMAAHDTTTYDQEKSSSKNLTKSVVDEQDMTCGCKSGGAGGCDSIYCSDHDEDSIHRHHDGSMLKSSHMHIQENEMRSSIQNQDNKKGDECISECCCSCCCFTETIHVLSETPQIFIEAMACCHNLSIFHDEVVGDLMESQLLKYTRWTLHEKSFWKQQHQQHHSLAEMVSPNQLHSIHIIRRYEFLPEIQRMSVITYSTSKQFYYVFCKGSPEQLELRCKKSTLPLHYHAVLQHYTKYGMRVLAFGYKQLDRIQGGSCLLQYSRDFYENDLTFLGFVLFVNKLKPETRQTIQSLKQAGIRCLLATGDNPYTSLAVAYQSSIIQTPQHQHEWKKNQHDDFILIGQVKQQIKNESLKSESLESESLKSESLKNKIVWRPFYCNYSVLQHDDGDQQNEEEDEKDSYCYLHHTNFIAMTEETQQQHQHCLKKGVVLSKTFDKKNKLIDENDNTTLTLLKSSQKLKANEKTVCLNETTGDIIIDDRIATTSSSPELTSKSIIYDEEFENSVIASEVLYTTKDVIKLLGAQSNILSSNITLVLTGPVLRTLYKLSVECPNDYCIEVHPKYNLQSCYEQYKSSTSIPVTHDSSFDDESRRHDHCHTYDSHSMFKEETSTSTNKKLTLFEYCLRLCRIYTRMTPGDKAFLVKQLQNLTGEPLIGMCGDGANDCEALKASDIGVSLSGEVTSLCAPVTSMKKSVQSCCDVLCEGRGALVNSFQSFKFVSLYAMVLVFSTVLMYYYGGNLTDEQFLWIDLIIDLPLTMTMALTHASQKLSTQLPLRSLVGLPVIASVFGQAAIQIFFICVGLYAVTQTSYYKRFVPDIHLGHFSSENLEGYENTTVFMISTWQYVILNIVLSAGRPWRKSRLTNKSYMLMITVAIFLCIAVYISQDTLPQLQEWLGLVDLDSSFRLLLFLLSCLNFIVSYCFERFVVSWLARREMHRDNQWNCIDHRSHFEKP